MSRGELRLEGHSVHSDRQVVEVWWDGHFLATVTVSEEAPLLRITSRHVSNPSVQARQGDGVTQIEIELGAPFL